MGNFHRDLSIAARPSGGLPKGRTHADRYFRTAMPCVSAVSLPSFILVMTAWPL